ncbi:MAG: S41 family peptidase [Planctomycetota bacterium]|nr:S41 family peptidase [Planctomycetota bacterium]
MPPRNLLILAVAILTSFVCHQKATERRFASLVAEGMDEVADSYVKDIDRRQLFEGAMRGMVQQLDPYSEYISPDDFKQFESSLDQEFGGIGIMVDKNEQGYLVVFSPVLGTPAYEAGLMAGDRIVEIEGKDTREISIEDSVKLMRGAPGSLVAFKLLQGEKSEPTALTLERAIIQVESVAGDERQMDGSWDYHLAVDRRIGYLRVSKFGKQTTEEVVQAMKGLQGSIQALVIDLRGNAGGLLDAAVSICDLFLDEGVIVTTRGRNPEKVLENFSAHASDTVLDPKLPVVVLINHYSASASEIVAACLQDHHRAKIVGERSWGKGTIQRIIPLEKGLSALRLTTATYWRPSGRNIHRDPEAKDEELTWGVVPDEGFIVAVTPEVATEIVRARRERDVVRRPTDSQGAGSSADHREGTGQELADPQLKKAVEYLQSELPAVPAA